MGGDRERKISEGEVMLAAGGGSFEALELPCHTALAYTTGRFCRILRTM